MLSCRAILPCYSDQTNSWNAALVAYGAIYALILSWKMSNMLVSYSRLSTRRNPKRLDIMILRSTDSLFSSLEHLIKLRSRSSLTLMWLLQGQQAVAAQDRTSVRYWKTGLNEARCSLMSLIKSQSCITISHLANLGAQPCIWLMTDISFKLSPLNISSCFFVLCRPAWDKDSVLKHCYKEGLKEIQSTFTSSPTPGYASHIFLNASSNGSSASVLVTLYHSIAPFSNLASL